MEEGTTTGTVSTAGVAQESVNIPKREKQIVLWLNNINHAMNRLLIGQKGFALRTLPFDPSTGSGW
jgi:hypothetical protein